MACERADLQPADLDLGASSSRSWTAPIARCRPVRSMPLPRWTWAVRTSTSRPRWAPLRRPSASWPGCRGGCHAGCDGKTGETLLKSVLAPMFAARNLHVMSWVGHNIFGNMDGRVLDDPANKQAKLQSKDRLLGEILGYRPQTPHLDRVHRKPGRLENRLGPHSLHRIPGNAHDAAVHLARVRFGAGRAAGDRPGSLHRAGQRRGQTGLLKFLASFFKSPLGVERTQLHAPVPDAPAVDRRGRGPQSGESHPWQHKTTYQNRT